MCDTRLVVRAKRVIGTLSWTDGFTECQCPERRQTRRDVLARVKYLRRRGRREEARKLLDDYNSK